LVSGVLAAAKARHAEAQPAEHEEREKDLPDVVKAAAHRCGNGGRPADRAGCVMRDGLHVDNVHGT